MLLALTFYPYYKSNSKGFKNFPDKFQVPV